MLRVVRVREDKRHLLGAITHIDGTARVQTLTRADNPFLYETIMAFEALTGVPVLMNTSFNLAGKPVVEALDDVLECYLHTGMGALVAGKALMVKPAGPDKAAGPGTATPELEEYRNLCDHIRQLRPAL